MNSEYLNEKHYSNFVGGIAILHDCQMVDVDHSEQVINFSGSPKNADGYATELKALLGRRTRK